MELTGIFLEPGKSIFAQGSKTYYKIIKYLGQGGNAIAFRVQCTNGPYRGIAFVLKVQYNLSTETRRERFLRETSFLKEEVHPAILRHFDEGDYRLPDGRVFPFVITNYFPQTLADIIKQQTANFSEKVLYSCQLLSALQLLQSKNVVHRDIKPNNIFVNGSNAVLGDFGLIKVLDTNNQLACSDDDDIEMIKETAFHAADGYIAMPYFYRTPELVAYANKQDVLHIESDIFQLGLVLTELFTGNNPLLPSTDIKAPIRLNRIGQVTGTNDSGLIVTLLRKMLKENYNERPSIDELLSNFTMLYEKVGA